MSRTKEIPDISEIPIPLKNYVNLIRSKKSPYYDCVKYILLEMEKHLMKSGRNEIIYTINPRVLEKEISERIKNEKLTRRNICRTILALFYSSELREGEDWYITTSHGGKKNYHIRVNPYTISILKGFL